jgi:MEDS: MEthanogen/methylotroph, DcmR Sensory domain
MSPCDHLVHFYKNATFLTEAVTSFIKEGLQVNDTVIIVATTQHHEELCTALTPGELAHDKLKFFAAEEQLSKIIVDDWPSELRFRNVVRGIIGQGSERGQVRIFAEMVAVLWAQGHTRAAMRLEELWNKVATEQPFFLLCAYPMSRFSDADKESLYTISQLHTHVHHQ